MLRSKSPRSGPYHFADALLRAAGGELQSVTVSGLAEHTFYATVRMADGTEIDARPSDALTLALVSGTPIAVDPAVLDALDPYASERPQFAAEATGPHDGSSVIADEVRARLADQARELAALDQPG